MRTILTALLAITLALSGCVSRPIAGATEPATQPPTKAYEVESTVYVQGYVGLLQMAVTFGEIMLAAYEPLRHRHNLPRMGRINDETIRPLTLEARKALHDWGRQHLTMANDFQRLTEEIDRDRHLFEWHLERVDNAVALGVMEKYATWNLRLTKLSRDSGL